MSVAVEAAIAAYNEKAASDFTIARMHAHQAHVQDRVSVANHANEALGLDGADELVWNHLPVQMVGDTPVYTFKAHGFDFLTYVSRSRRRGEESPTLYMRVASWAAVRKTIIDSVETDGWRLVFGLPSFGEAALIAALEAQMPDRLESRNRQISTPNPYNVTPAQEGRLRSFDFGGGDHWFHCDTEVEMYEQILRIYQAEKGARHACGPARPVSVAKPEKPKKTGLFVWSKP